MGDDNDEGLIKPLKPYLILSGLWKIPLTSSKFFRTLYVWYSLGLKSIFLVFLVLIFFKSVQLVLTSADLQAISSSVAILLPTAAVWTKILIYRKNKVPEMLEEIIEVQRKIHQSLDDDLITVYNRKVMFCKKLILGIIFNVIFVVGSFFIVSLVQFLKADQPPIEETEIEEALIEKPFMYPFWLPIRESESMKLVIMLNALFATATIILYSVSYMIIGTLMVFAAANLELLNVTIRKITFDYMHKVETNLREVFMIHVNAIKFTEELNRSINYVIFVDFLLNSINVASVAVQVLNAPSQIIFPLAYLGILVLQVFTLGWLSNEIKLQSEAIADALYDTNWFNQDGRTRKIFQIMLMRSQKPLILSIGPFGPMTLTTALTTMRAAYSYITLMQNYK